nr:protein IQ-DOMAIN 14-like [Tanacetum cinerariifolium]
MCLNAPGGQRRSKSSKVQQNAPKKTSYEGNQVSREVVMVLDFSEEIDASVRTVLFTVAKSDSSRSCLSGYSDHPNYMSHTQSSRAKVRSLSAPSGRRRLKYSNVQQNDDQHREVVGEPKKASYGGTVFWEVVMVLEFFEEINKRQSPSSIQEVVSCAFSSRGSNFHPFTCKWVV